MTLRAINEICTISSSEKRIHEIFTVYSSLSLNSICFPVFLSTLRIPHFHREKSISEREQEKAMRRRIARIAVSVVLFVLLSTGLATGAFAQSSTFFTPGNLVVSVEGCGVHGGTCAGVANGTGSGTGNSSVTGYGDNQAAPMTLFQYAPNEASSVTFVNSLVSNTGT